MFASPAKLTQLPPYCTYAPASPASLIAFAAVVVAQPPTNSQPTPARWRIGKVLQPEKPRM